MKNPVHHVEVPHYFNGAAHNFYLFVSQQPGVLDENDARMDLSGVGQFEEVAHIGGDQHSLLGEGLLQDKEVVCSEQTTIANVAGVESIIAKRFGYFRRQVFVQKELHGWS